MDSAGAKPTSETVSTVCEQGNDPRSNEFNKTLDEEAVRTEKHCNSRILGLVLKQCLPSLMSQLIKGERSIASVKLKITELEQAFENFKGAHEVVYTKIFVEDESIKSDFL